MLLKKLHIIVISDIHFGRKDDKRLYEELQSEFIPHIDENLDLLVIAGDLFDRVVKLNEMASIYVFKFIDQLYKLSKIYNFKIRLLQGTKTHDFNQLQNFRGYEDEDDRFGIAEEVCEEEIFEGLDVLYIPEEYVEDADEYYKEFFNNKYDMIFFHGTMDFAGFAGHIKETKNIKQAPNFKSDKIASLVRSIAIGGHIHIKQSYNNKIYYTGSFSRFNFGESESKGFYYLTYDPTTKNTAVKFIKNKLAPEYVTIKLSDVPGNLEEKIKNIELLKEDYENIRIEVSEEEKNSNETVVEAIKNLTDDNVKLKVDNSFKENYDTRYDFILKKELSLEETIKKYVQMTKNKNLDVQIIKKLITENEN